MNEEDLRDCFAMFKIITGASPSECYRFADEMLDARKKEKNDEENTGIVTVVPKRTRKR